MGLYKNSYMYTTFPLSTLNYLCHCNPILRRTTKVLPIRLKLNFKVGSSFVSTSSGACVVCAAPPMRSSDSSWFDVADVVAPLPVASPSCGVVCRCDSSAQTRPDVDSDQCAPSTDKRSNWGGLRRMRYQQVRSLRRMTSRRTAPLLKVECWRHTCLTSRSCADQHTWPLESCVHRYKMRSTKEESDKIQYLIV